ncbi:MAG: hypothetical protein M1826_006368 [Phylliscum demangeonii]|nr:MAG: hypothetical protein M1826_006368 [Phylliscum demangeonii]
MPWSPWTAVGYDPRIARWKALEKEAAKKKEQEDPSGTLNRLRNLRRKLAGHKVFKRQAGRFSRTFAQRILREFASSDQAPDEFCFQPEFRAISTQRLDENKAFVLCKIMKEHQERAQMMLSILNDRPEESTNAQFTQRQAVHQCAIRAAMEQAMCRAAAEAKLVDVTGGVALEVDDFLEEFFAICQFPGPEEIHILARAADVSVFVVSRWCTFQRAHWQNRFLS